MIRLIGQGEVQRPEAAQRRRRLAAVAQLGELEVGQHAGPAPQPGEEEDRQDARDGPVPPQPVAGDAVAGHQPGHDQRRVRREGRRDHRGAGEPPRQRAARDEVLVERLARLADIGQPDRGGDDEVEQDDQPVGEGEMHRDPGEEGGWGITGTRRCRPQPRG